MDTGGGFRTGTWVPQEASPPGAQHAGAAPSGSRLASRPKPPRSGPTHHPITEVIHTVLARVRFSGCVSSEDALASPAMVLGFAYVRFALRAAKFPGFLHMPRRLHSPLRHHTEQFRGPKHPFPSPALHPPTTPLCAPAKLPAIAIYFLRSSVFPECRIMGIALWAALSERLLSLRNPH